MESFELAGEWWLPESPETRTIGLVKFSNEDGFRLDIPFGCLGQMSDFAQRLNHFRRAPVVHGVLRNGKAVTLFDATLSGANLHFPGTASEQYMALLGFIGESWLAACPQVDRIEINYGHLRDWVLWQPASYEQSVEGDVLGRDVTYTYREPSNVALAAGEGWLIKLSHSANASLPSVTGFQLEHDCVLTLELNSPLDFEEASDRFRDPLTRFLSFCLDRHIHTRRLRVRLADSTWLDVGRAQGPSASGPDEDDVVLEPFMLASLRQLGDRTADVLRRWLELTGDEQRATALLVGVNGDWSSAVDLRFLATAQALEAMSRVVARQEELEPEEFERRRKAVAAAVSDRKVRDWAMRKLEHSNVRSASELLADLMVVVGRYAARLAPDRKRFLADVRDNRNFYTHRDDRRAPKILEARELHLLTEGLICLLKAAVLRRLGYSEDATASLLGECQGALQWAHRVAQHYRLSPEN